MPRPMTADRPRALSQDPARLQVLLAAVLAAAAPSLLAYNVSPSPTFLNQALALGLWGSFVLVAAAGRPSAGGFAASRQAWTVQAALALLALAATWSTVHGSLPLSLGLSSLGLLGAAALLVHAGAAAGGARDAPDLFALFCWGWLLAGCLNLAIGLVQVFAPGLPDGDWIATSSIVGRAVGNLRQPNHLSSLLLWAAIACVALLQLRRMPRSLGTAVFAAMIFGVVLTASRTGLVSVGILALWGLLDRRLHRATRWLLVSALALYAAAWFGMARWAEYSHHTFGGAARLAETDVSGSRFGIWSNTLALIRAQPWTGVGFGEFNLAWTLTPFPGRPTAFFDHTHNLPLQLAVELGLPLAGLVLLLLVGGLLRMARLAWRAQGDDATTHRVALMFVLMIGLHSLLEYPLWYAYFLLPAAWALGFGLASPNPAPARGRPLLAPAGALLTVLAAFSVWDYGRVTAIFSADDTAPPLAQRIERGQHSVFFAHHADYAAATTDTDERLRARAFDGATHYLLDTRLMMAWADELAARGDLDRARHLAARLREFHNPLSKEWFAACDAPAKADKADPAAAAAATARPFQCAAPQTALDWRAFVP
jgi:O-antigen ligase